MKNKIALSIALLMLVSLMPFSAFAASGTIDEDGIYDISVYGNDSVITIDSAGSAEGLTVTLTNTSGNTYTNLRINCVDAGTKLTIDGVKIDCSATADACALAFADAGNTLTLVGDSILKSGENEPGIRVESGAALTISGSGAVDITGGDYSAGIGGGRYATGGTITINDGSITSTGGEYGAGIGGGDGKMGGGDGGVITILGGTVEATGGTDGAGIGGGMYGTGGIITIENGTVTATGGSSGAGIGGGSSGAGGAITINNGTVTATGAGGAGIGGGRNGTGGTITINDGEITAEGGESGAGIGGGNGEGGDITIQGGTVEATGGTYGAGIGGGDGAGADITIQGGTVEATGGTYGAGIGGGNNSMGSTITIENGTVTATGGSDGAGIGSGEYGAVGTITIENGVVTATGGSNGAGIGSGESGAGGTIAIENGMVTATGGNGGAGIGGGSYGTCGTIMINDGVIIATGRDHAAGIGGGNRSAGGIITIENGTVTATGGSSGAGIGGGDGEINGGDGGNITISGGTVEATGGESGAGIGGGSHGTGGTITINDGAITSTGGDYGAGIGGGDGEISGGDGGDITIQGGTVTTSGGILGAGIGGGRYGTGGIITIENGTVTATGGSSGAGIGGGDYGAGGDITILGGTVEATGGTNGAGIGGGGDGAGGTIAINDGEIASTGGESGAGIGGGDYGAGGDITIQGGTVTAAGGYMGAGIGGGEGEAGGDITIQGGTVEATGGAYGAGIGGGHNSTGSTITIENGTVTAIGGIDGAGIGGGSYSVVGTICIQGGWVFADKGTRALHDIGLGVSPITGTEMLYIFGDSGVFLRHDLCLTPTATAHTHLSAAPIDNDKLYGVDMPAGWTQAGAYIIPFTLSYDANGGTGTVPADVLQHRGTTVQIPLQGDMENGGLTLKQWNTDPGGMETGYCPGSDFKFRGNTTLYAIWGEVDITSVTLDRHTLNLSHNGTETLIATVAPADATNNAVVWSSSAPGVAGVDQSGNVTGIGIGSATITATADGKSDACSVTVGKKSVTAVTLNHTTKSLIPGEIVLLTALVSPSDATYPEVTWSSDDTSVVTVSQNGLVTAVGLGSTAVTATADGKTGTCHINVSEIRVTDVILSSATKELVPDQATSLYATVSPSDATHPEVTWSSSDTSIATVSQTGLVTAIAIGNVTITASADGAEDTCLVTVSAYEVMGLTLTLDGEYATMISEGDTIKLIANVLPLNAVNQNITWTSSDSSVATVSQNGVVTAVGEGNAIITAEMQGNSDTYRIAVSAGTQPPTETEPMAQNTPSLTDEATAALVPEPTPKTIVNKVIVMVEINVSELPEGTTSVKTPGGEVVELNGEETITVMLDKDDFENDGIVEIIALDEEQVALGSINIQTDQMPKAAPSVWETLLWILLGIVSGAVFAVVVIHFLIKKKKA